MNKRETFALLKMISVFYEQFSVDQEKFNLWHDALKDCTYVDIEQNLLTHVQQSPYPPKVSELYIKSTVTRLVPDSGKTKIMLTRKNEPANIEVVKKELAKMRKILGIEREKPKIEEEL